MSPNCTSHHKHALPTFAVNFFFLRFLTCCAPLLICCMVSIGHLGGYVSLSHLFLTICLDTTLVDTIYLYLSFGVLNQKNIHAGHLNYHYKEDHLTSAIFSLPPMGFIVRRCCVGSCAVTSQIARTNVLVLTTTSRPTPVLIPLEPTPESMSFLLGRRF